METVIIRTNMGEKEVKSFAKFEVFGENFHVTRRHETKTGYTATHEETGFCLMLHRKTIKDCITASREHLEGYGKEKVITVLNQYKEKIEQGEFD
ncbi:hypothetical protein [Draconibacterium mangrovi]|uniref:hypothetical protein n=1 Tax=Draconibacterium mangrovi TaxID=2697469 RepID=UPI0013D19FD9|nr:hypothetical protein [Draconibacterium mangrovi]